MSAIVLDVGALVALERDDRAVWAALKLAAAREIDVVIPSAALAQVWRGGPRQAVLSRVLGHCVIASFDAVVRDVGELCGRTRTDDVCDAHVAIVAAKHGAVLWTSDPADMRRLLAAITPRRSITIVRC